jgi:nitric-oxide synthase, bacterial
MDTAASLLRRIPLLASLSDPEIERLAQDATIAFVPAGETILHEGDYGDRMYIVESGAVQVWAKAFDGSDVVLARLEQGAWFGEQAILPEADGLRNASVRALQPARLLTISRESLHNAVRHDAAFLARLRAIASERDTFRSEKLRESLFAALNVDAGSESYSIETFRAGETIFREGEPGARVYLVLRGRVRIEKSTDGDSVLAEILPGQFFGELAILNNSPRQATAVAAENLEVAALDGAWFRAAQKQPVLSSLLSSLSSMYLLPHRGLLTLQNGTFEGLPCVTAVHHLADGRRVVSTRTVGTAAFHSQVLGVEGGPEIVAFLGTSRGVTRELHVLDGRLVGIHSTGEWSGLGRMLELLLGNEPLFSWQVELFRERGEIQAAEEAPLYEKDEVLCTCAKATFGQILRAIGENCHTLESIANKTGATRVCGGCVPLVKELLGRSDWSVAKITKTTTLAPDIRTFRITPADGTCKPWLPGQHLVVQARVDNRNIQRAYTLSSAPTDGRDYEITVKREPGGVFSRWLFAGGEGSFLRISEPAGNYYLPEGHRNDVVCFAGGIGITPALAMVRSVVARSRDLRLHIDYSVGHDAQAICQQELLDATQRNSRISFKLRVTRRDGRLRREDVAAVVERHSQASYFLCGSAGYMEAIEGYLRACGVPESSIRSERFHIAGEVPPVVPVERKTCPVDQTAHAGEAPETPLEAARAFLRQCYSEAGAARVFESRWQQVEAEFLATGTYRQTAEELAFATRVAWRNAARCIGRLYSQGLAVRDCRHVTTSAGMLDAIMGHIELALNGGNLRPAITVFPQRQPDGAGPRIWSPQLFRYAGYKLESGSVLGDPANVELTDVAMGLGWNPPSPRTAFDLLPVIAQAAGGRPEWREIPLDLRLEVPVVHPQFSWFADLGLRWYALPAVSDMMLDAGGIVYPAIPFNGWYMGTEIGARNFGDTNRYNLLPVVARKMGLDTSNDRTLWRDRAIVELNVAVLHSYELSGVTMMDHHSASHAFNKFEEIENGEGRVVHANWSWIVPPISGSTVTVFHSDHWQNIELKPKYVHQSDPWKSPRSNSRSISD